MDRFLRLATPIVLLVLAALALLEPVLPGGGEDSFLGQDGVLRFIVAVLCVYVLMLVAERQAMEDRFKQVLGAFRDHHAEQGAVQAGKDAAAAKQEAVTILIAALRSDDPMVRETAAENLRRLSGEDHGEDPAAWQAWLTGASATKQP